MSLDSTLDFLFEDMQDLRDRSPEEAWLHLLRLRASSYFQRRHGLDTDNFENIDREHLNDEAVAFAYSPVNPVLLASLLALATEADGDLKGMLRTYAGCSSRLILEEDLILLHDKCDEDQLGRVLDAEQIFLAALLNLAHRTCVARGFRLIRTVISQDDDDPDLRLYEATNVRATLWDLIWATWVISNPCIYDPFAETDFTNEMLYKSNIEFEGAVGLGFWSNSKIHNSATFYSNQLQGLSQQINDALRSKQDRQTQLQLAQKHGAYALLVQRARRLYYWAPHEVSAYQGSEWHPNEDIAPSLFYVARGKEWLLPTDLLQFSVLFGND
ncbi:MAG TPA: hypothetical protein VG796_24820 [Verrucomicrobiales bacterium]|nr:hypothetical protein [Verrucomicrobiales bacterium]